MYDALQVFREERLRDEAAREILAAIRQDAEGASADLRPVLLDVADRLFDPELTVAGLAARWAMEPGALRASFLSSTGRTPGQYLTDRRMEVGDLLVRGTELSAKAVARVLGYSISSRFRRDYKEWSGASFSKRRAAAPLGRPVAGDPDVRPEEQILVWRPALAGAWLGGGRRGVDVGSSLSLVLDLLATIAGRNRELGGLFPDVFYETWKAVKARRAAFEEPLREQAARVAFPMPLGSLVLAELLGSAGERAAPPSAALHLARLAVASLESCSEGLPAEALGEYAVRVHTRWARQALTEGELAEAERALVLGELRWRELGEHPGVEAELLEAKASLRWRQESYAGAAELAGRAEALYRRAGEPAAAARCLNLQLKARRGAGAESVDVPALEEALAAAENAGDASLAEDLAGELMKVYVRARRLPEAGALLARLNSLALYLITE